MIAKPHASVEAHVLYVDDEEFVRSALRRTLRRSNITVTAVESGEAALTLIAEDPARFTVVASDHDMGAGMNGTTFLGRVAKIAPAIPRILVSGHLDSHRLLQAINSSGVYHVVEKPWDGDMLVDVVQRASKQCEQTRANARLLHRLETENEALSRSKDALEHRLHQTRKDLVRALSAVIALKDARLKGRGERAAAYALSIGKLLGLAPPALDDLRDAALLFDLGRLGSVEEFETLAQGLPEKDRAVLEAHPRVCAELLEGVAVLAGPAAIARDQFERWDGSGTPSGKEGTAIAEGARIVAIAHALAATEGFEVVLAGAGSAYDPELVRRIVAQGQPLLGG
ncbi:MAG: response regulator [Myxococcota bacterium]